MSIGQQEAAVEVKSPYNPLGLYVQKHTDKNYGVDGGGFGKQCGKLYEQAPKIKEYLDECKKAGTDPDPTRIIRLVRNETGDMPGRGIWTFEGRMNYATHCQFSCSVGIANVYDPSGLDRVKELTKEFGHIFIFTGVQESIKQAALKRPDDFVPLATTESWMTKNRMVTIFGSKA